MPLAQQLREYIRRRAEVEGVGFDLPIELFEQAVIRRAKTFGVVHDGHEMLHDEWLTTARTSASCNFAGCSKLMQLG